MRASTRVLPALLIMLFGCVDNERFGDDAAACAEVVRIHRDLDNAVEVIEVLERTDAAEVVIRYEGVDAMNLPEQGEAACRFSAGASGTLTLSSAIVDRMVLTRSEIDAVRSKLPRSGD